MSVFRIAEFLINIAQLELRQGKSDKCQNWLEQLKEILQPVLKSSSKSKFSREGIEEPLFTGHPETCKCIGCVDSVLHTIFINYFVSFSKYLSSVSRPEESIHTLEVTETVCECAERKMAKSLERLDSILCSTAGVESNDDSLREAKKKGKGKSAKGRKQKEDMTVKSCSLQLMFSQHYITLCCMNAEVLLQNGKAEKANDVLSRGMEILHCAENIIGNTPVHLLAIKISLLHLSGVTTLLLNKGSSSNGSVDCNWFSKHQVKKVSDDTVVSGGLVEEAEIEKPKKGSSRRGRSSKAAEKVNGPENDGKSKSSRAKCRGRTKKTEEPLTECVESDADVQQKTKRRKRAAKSAKSTCKDVDDKQIGMAISKGS